MSSPAPAAVAAPTFRDHAHGLIATGGPLLLGLCAKCQAGAQACMQHLSVNPAVGSFVNYVKQEASNVYSHPRCKAGITSALGSVASLVPEYSKPFLLFAQCSAGMTDELGSIVHAAAGAAETRAQETLFRNTLSEVAGSLQEAVKELPPQPTFDQVCEFLKAHPEIVGTPLGKRLVAQFLVIPMWALKKGAGSLISQSSKINGGLATCALFLRIAESWSGSTSENTKTIANYAFQLFLTISTGYKVLQNFRNATGIWNKTKQLTAFGALGILAPTLLTKFGVDFSISMRNLLLLGHYRRGTIKLLCKALFAASIAGGINGAVELPASAKK